MFKLRKSFFLVVLAAALFIAFPAHAGNYTVASGDSLYKIGGIFETGAESISKLNNLNGDTIYPGQVLKVPSDVYTVKSGDTLYLIAKRFGVSLYSLRRANNKWDDMIYAGQALNLPGAPKAGTAVTPTVPTAPVKYTQAEYDLLSRLITAEADSEPYSAKVGVGAVVLNRVKSGSFPDSINEVIYQVINGYYQFTPVENGMINKPASADSKKAAYEALSGSDPSHGALFYFDDSATNKWLWSKPITARIGRMVFVY